MRYLIHRRAKERFENKHITPASIALLFQLLIRRSSRRSSSCSSRYHLAAHPTPHFTTRSAYYLSPYLPVHWPCLYTVNWLSCHHRWINSHLFLFWNSQVDDRLQKEQRNDSQNRRLDGQAENRRQTEGQQKINQRDQRGWRDSQLGLFWPSFQIWMRSHQWYFDPRDGCRGITSELHSFFMDDQTIHEMSHGWKILTDDVQHTTWRCCHTLCVNDSVRQPFALTYLNWVRRSYFESLINTRDCTEHPWTQSRRKPTTCPPSNVDTVKEASKEVLEPVILTLSGESIPAEDTTTASTSLHIPTKPTHNLPLIHARPDCGFRTCRARNGTWKGQHEHIDNQAANSTSIVLYCTSSTPSTQITEETLSRQPAYYITLLLVT